MGVSIFLFYKLILYTFIFEGMENGRETGQTMINDGLKSSKSRLGSLLKMMGLFL